MNEKHSQTDETPLTCWIVLVIGGHWGQWPAGWPTYETGRSGWGILCSRGRGGMCGRWHHLLPLHISLNVIVFAKLRL